MGNPKKPIRLARAHNRYYRTMMDRLAKQLLKESFTDNIGLLNGKMGLAIFFFQYGRHSGDKLYETFAGDLLDEVFEEISARTPLDFKSGLCGIGWSIVYLINNKFLDGDPNEILEELDKIVFEYDMAKSEDTSFETGSAGIGFYRAFRNGEYSRYLPNDLKFNWGNITLSLSAISELVPNSPTDDE